MNDESLLRYSRHIFLKEWDVPGQIAVSRANVLVVGAGGLGAPALLYLAAAGVGSLTVIDNDSVDLTNLQRQIIHQNSSIGQNKACSACETLNTINPHVNCVSINQKADKNLLEELLPQKTIVLDCSDNYETRHIVNQACVKHRVALISGAATGFKGQLTSFSPKTIDSPCYACLFAPSHIKNNDNCASMGVFSPITGVIGSLQASEALRYIVGIGKLSVGKIILFDGLNNIWNEFLVKKDSKCTVCS